MFFWKTSEGGGAISNPKNYIADFFGFKTVYFGRKFWTKCPKRGSGGVISNPKNFVANLRKLMHIYEFSQKKRNEISKNEEGGWGSKAVWNFSKKHPYWRIQTSLRDCWISFTRICQVHKCNIKRQIRCVTFEKAFVKDIIPYGTVAQGPVG